MPRPGLPLGGARPAATRPRGPGRRSPWRVPPDPPPAGRVAADAAVTALQDATERAGGVVRHHRRVTAVEPDGDGVVVRLAAGAAVHARAAVVAAGAWTADVLGDAVRLPALRVTQEQPAHFRPLSAELDWPAFTSDPDPAGGWPGGVYGLLSPGEGVKVGF